MFNQYNTPIKKYQLNPEKNIRKTQRNGKPTGDSSHHTAYIISVIPDLPQEA